MKKIHIITIAAALLLTLGLSSCKKDYTCQCTTSQTGMSPIVTTSTIHGKHSDAKSACEGGSSTTTYGGITTTVACVIK